MEKVIKLTFLGGLPELKRYFERLSYSEGDCLGLERQWLGSTLIDGSSQTEIIWRLCLADSR